MIEESKIKNDKTHVVDNSVCISFSGSGLMLIYQLGVASAMHAQPKFMERVKRVRGTSGGAIVGAMLLACPEKIETAIDFYCSGGFLAMMRDRGQMIRDITHPHEDLLRASVDQLGLLKKRDYADIFAGSRFVAHVTVGPWPSIKNMGLSNFKSNEDVITAISASCCLVPTGKVYSGDGMTYWDGGLTDPMPDDDQLPTVTVSVLRGKGVDIAPSDVKRNLMAHGNLNEGNIEGTCPVLLQRSAKERSRFLRYDWSGKNIRALLDAGLIPMTGSRARERFDEGRRDASMWLTHLGYAAT